MMTPTDDNHPILMCLEHEIGPAALAEIAGLLDLCFPGTFEGRAYFKQLPHFRFLYRENGVLVGQAGIDSRIINIGGAVHPVFGVIDLCVHPQHRNAGIASRLLARLEETARLHGRHFLVLMADRHDLYLKRGFRRVELAETTWLAIEARQTVSVLQRNLGDCFLIKPLTPAPWPDGEIDLLGYLF